MPTYEYACKACGEHLEVVQSFKDEPLVECPACGGPLRKVFSPIGISFKGSGFYRTDSRSSGSHGSSTTSEGAPAKESKEAKDSKESKESKDTKASAPSGKKSAAS